MHDTVTVRDAHGRSFFLSRSELEMAANPASTRYWARMYYEMPLRRELARARRNTAILAWLAGVLAAMVIGFITIQAAFRPAPNACLPSLPRQTMVVPENMSGIVISKTPVRRGIKKFADRLY